MGDIRTAGRKGHVVFKNATGRSESANQFGKGINGEMMANGQQSTACWMKEKPAGYRQDTHLNFKKKKAHLLSIN
jgi:hypothetical protein